MSITIGIDLGTTTITALALDASSGNLVACCSAPNEAEITSPEDRARGRCEWDAGRIINVAFGVVRDVAAHLAGRTAEVIGIGLTGQQHGVVIVDERRRPLTSFINWRDRRGAETVPGAEQTYLQQLIQLVGAEYAQRTGCLFAPGFMGLTLHWMKDTDTLPSNGSACFLTDYFASVLTEERPVTDPTNGASSGLLHVASRDWDRELIGALDLPASLFPEVREAGDSLGALSRTTAEATGLAAGLPVFVGLGDNQASFLGSVASRAESVLVNVGTGGQVSMFCNDFVYAPPLETRPFPRGGYLVTEVGLCGGRSYAALAEFFRSVGMELFGQELEPELYELMNESAASVPEGADGLRCEPFFTGTRAEPERRAQWTGMSDRNFTPAHMTRALLEGMARTFRQGGDLIQRATGQSCRRLVGSGNGLRENPVLTQIVAEEFGLPVAFTRHREEAAYGAALVASVGARVFPNLQAASCLIEYE